MQADRAASVQLLAPQLQSSVDPTSDLSSRIFMSDTRLDTSKRTWLIASGCAGAVGGIATAVPFVSTFQPSEKAKAAGAARAAASAHPADGDRGRNRPHENGWSPVPMLPERRRRRRGLRRPERLRPQHPQDPGPPPGLACADDSRNTGSPDPTVPAGSGPHTGLIRLFRLNDLASASCATRHYPWHQHHEPETHSSPGRAQPWRSPT